MQVTLDSQRFTNKSARAILGQVLRQPGLVQPEEEETEPPVFLLNRLAGQLLLDETKDKGAASDVQRGLENFELLFDRRRAAAIAQEAPPRILAAEERSRQQFLTFRDAMTSRPYELDMDRGTRAIRWHSYAELVASSFVATVAWRNPKVVIGLTDKGPLVMFLKKVIPLISAEAPTAAAIGKHLRRCAKRLEQKSQIEDGEESGSAYLRRTAKRQERGDKS
jgi:hypothetical protein